MSSPESSAKKVAPKKRSATHSRSPSASEIARNSKHFETWSSNQGCEQVSYFDLPEGCKDDVECVFDVSGRLPMAWVDKTSVHHASWSNFVPPEIKSFIRQAYVASPELFTEDVSFEDTARLYGEISIVYSAWRRLKQMHKSKEKWSEADYVANVYNVFRSPALHESTQRVQCAISLPQPLRSSKLGTRSSRILNAKTAVPDCAIFIPASTIRPLSHSAKSPFKTLKTHTTIAKAGSASKGSSFRYQSTPCANLPDIPGFEFASSFWEDKKPLHQMLEDAYRQNRMSTASAVRHLHSLSIQAPVFGLVWANATVQAHVDWCHFGDIEDGGGKKSPVILSAPYPGEDGDEGLFHEWMLERPGDILQVYFLIRNIDIWTNGRFHELVREGVNRMVDEIVEQGKAYEPWKRVGDLPLAPSARTTRKENVSITTQDTTTEVVVKVERSTTKRKKRT